jgi:hypothetical protein
MTYHDDPDLERRLRRIAEAPEPPVPGSVFRYANEVTTRERGFHMLTSVPRPRPGLVVGLASVAVVLTLVAAFSLALRSSQTGGPSVEPSASASAPAATPSESPASSGTPGATLRPIDFETPGVAADWAGFSWSGQPAPSPLLVDETLSGGGVTQVLRWKGGYAATGSITSGGETRPSSGLWTSADGQKWTAVTGIDAPAVFVSAAPFGLLAIGTNSYPLESSAAVSTWTSSDGLTWSKAGTPNLPGTVVSLAGTDKAIVATVMIETGADKKAKDTYQILYSTDGLNWTPETVSQVLASAEGGGGLPPHVQANDGHFFLMGSGIVDGEAVDEMWLSDDGKTWTKSAGGYELYADYIDFGRDGMVLHTTVVAAPGANLQAYSTDGGATWHDDKSYGPLGQAVCEGPCGTGPDGVIGSNGTVFVAVEGGGNRAWLSYDGHTWSAISWAGGDPTPAEGTGAGYGGWGFTVMPRGVLLQGTYGAAK